MHRRRRLSDWPGLIGGIAMMLVAACLIHIGWILYGSGLDTTRIVETGDRMIRTPIPVEAKKDALQWRHSEPPDETTPVRGEVFAWMFLPDVDRTWSRAIWEGTSDDILDGMGVGHYETTPMPGGAGNSAYAGHDTVSDFGLTYRLKAGDAILIRTASHWYRYEVTETRLLTSADTWAIGMDAPGVERGITLTTCWPMFTPVDTGQRFITWGRYVGWADVTDGTPPELADTAMTTVDQWRRTVMEKVTGMRLPVTGVLSATCLIEWLTVDGLLWIGCRKRMLILWDRRRGSWNPVGWLWRLQAGPVDGSRPLRVLSAGIRSLLFTLMLGAITFACWRWACPWLADMIPWLDAPHSAF